MAARELWRRTASVLHRPALFYAAPASLQQRGFANERREDSSTSNWGAGEPPIDEKATERGVKPGSTPKEEKSDSEGQVSTPSLTRQKSTKDFINSKREERMKFAQGSRPMEDEGEGDKVRKTADEVKEGAPHTADRAGS